MENKTFLKMMSCFPVEEKHEMKMKFLDDIEKIKKFIPRGRFRMGEDGRAICVSRNKRFENDYIAYWGPSGLSLYTEENGIYWYGILKPYLIGKYDGQRENAIFHFNPIPEAVALLTKFQLNMPNGRPFKKAVLRADPTV